jgi:hypothetical protein
MRSLKNFSLSKDLLKRWSFCIAGKEAVKGGVSVLRKMGRNQRMLQKPNPQSLVRWYIVSAIRIRKLPGAGGKSELHEAQISSVTQGTL